MSEPARKKVRYVPAPQESQQVALTEEQLRTLIRQMVREELAAVKQQQALQLPDWARERGML